MTRAFTLLSAVTSTGAGTAADTSKYSRFTAATIASSVTSGATVKIQGSIDGSNWGDIATVSVSANGTTLSEFTTTCPQIRGNITARTDGVYTVLLAASGN